MIYNRKTFIKRAVLASAGIGALDRIKLDQFVEDENKKFSFQAHPVLANMQSHEVEVIVSPNDLATGWVEYGIDDDLNMRTHEIIHGMYNTSDKVLRFKINNLKPGREYSYRVHLHKIVYHNGYRHERDDQISSDVYRFKTLDPQETTGSFTCWNDTHENNETLRQLSKELNQNQTDFLIWNGDVTNDIFNEEQIVGQFLNPGGHAYATSVPVMFSRGNHDVRGRDARLLQQYINGMNGRYHYAFRQGPIACLVLDTGEDKPDDHVGYAGLLNFSRYREEQANWLKEVIREPWFKSAPHRVAFMHIPLVWEAEVPERWPDVWGEGIKGWICEDGHNKWHDLLSEAKVQVVISGHTHRPAYFPPNRSRSYGQLIGGGPQPERATCIKGHADQNKLVVEMTNLEGQALEKIEYARVV